MEMQRAKEYIEKQLNPRFCGDIFYKGNLKNEDTAEICKKIRDKANNNSI